MQKERFSQLMISKKWLPEVKPDIETLQVKGGFDIDEFLLSTEYSRSNFFISVKNSEIKELKEEDFYQFFKERTKMFWFKDDWKEFFIGSEWLIPLVEREMETRKRLIIQNAYIQLSMVNQGHKRYEEVEKEYRNYLESDE